MMHRLSHKIRTGIVVLLLLASGYLFAIKPNHRSQQIAEPFVHQLYAHRGLYNDSVPENSLPAFRLAAEYGYGIEMDVQLTKDNIPVIFHDDSLKRMVRDGSDEKVSGRLHDYTLAELRQFHLKNSTEQIPTLEEFLDAVQGSVPVIVEYKVSSDTDVNVLCSICEEKLRQYDGNYCIQSFSSDVLLWYRVHRPEIMRGQLSGKATVLQNMSLSNIIDENVLLNFLTKPDFISYKEENYKNPSRQICHNVFNTVSAGWTIRSMEQLEQRRNDFDLFIFDGFLPLVHPDGSL